MGEARPGASRLYSIARFRRAALCNEWVLKTCQVVEGRWVEERWCGAGAVAGAKLGMMRIRQSNIYDSFRRTPCSWYSDQYDEN